MPKVTTVTKAPAKAAATKTPAPTNPARTMKVLKSFTVAHDSADLIAEITKAFDKYGRVAVTVQNDKALDRKMQQRVQSIAVRRGYDKNIKTAVDLDRGYVTGCPANESAPKTAIVAPATPRAPKAAPAKTPAKGKAPTKGEKVAAAIVGKVLADQPEVVDKVKAGVAADKTKTRRATRRRTDAQAAYDRTTFGKADAEKAEKLAAKEKEAADAATPHDIVIDGVTVLTVVPSGDTAEENEARKVADLPTVVAMTTEDLILQGVIDVANGLSKLDPPDPEAGLRIGIRGFDPVIETNYGQAVGRFRDREIAVAVMAEINRVRAEVAAGA